jgi:hypothetical protein
MPCKKSEMVQAINTYGNARSSNDPNLVNYASQLLVNYMETLEFEPEAETEEGAEAPAE